MVENLGVSDLTLVVTCAVLAALGILALYAMYKAKGREAVVALIMKAEYIFDWKGAGKEKAEYVLSKARAIVPAPYKWCLTLNFINRIVESLQPELKEMKDERKNNSIV